MVSGGNSYFYQKDALGSITSLTDNSESVVNTYEYDAFGNIINKTEAVNNPYGYTGRRIDSESGLMYYRERFYDPVIGRFLTSDPIGFSGGINFYSYVQNNPVNFVDPEGLSSSCKDASPLPSDSSECNEYCNRRYLGTRLKCFCKCAGDSPWSQKVRGCLRCMDNNNVKMTKAHSECYKFANTAGLKRPTSTLIKCYLKCL